MTSDELIAEAVNQGFPEAKDIVHIFAGGSHQHGAKLEGKADLDICGIYVPNAPEVIGIDQDEHFVGGTGDDKTRNKPDDIDVALYSLRKWAFLAAKGNPTVLSYLFMPARVDGVWHSLIAPRSHIFIASGHAAAFIGYGRAQLARLNGERGYGKHGQRDPLIDKFGYDCKAAMHMLRMMFECRELLKTGRMTFPRPEVETLLEIRRGEWSKSQIEREYLQMEAEVNALRDASSLPEKVDRKKVSELISMAHLIHWGMS